MKKISLMMLGAALIAVPVLAAPGGMHKGDADGNGVMTRVEAQAAATQMFTKMDVNKDGKLDATDRAAQKAERRTKQFTALDADKNGSVSKAEWDAPRADRAEKRGKPGAQRGEKRADAADGERRGQRKGGHHSKRGGHDMHGAMMKADTNGDKAISQAEFQTAALARFDRADANKDGQVTAAERKAAHDAMRAERGAGRGPAGN